MTRNLKPCVLTALTTKLYEPTRLFICDLRRAEFFTHCLPLFPEPTYTKIMQSRLKYELKDKTTNHFLFSGIIDETALFPKIDPSQKETHIDLEHVKYISSFGVKVWVEYFSKQDREFFFYKVTPSLLKNFNTVQGFFPTQALIQSLYAPFCNPTTFETKMLLLENNIHYGAFKELTLPSVSGNDGQPLEPDFVTNSYFRFLTLQKK